MKRSLPFLAVCLFSGAGCVVNHPLEQESLPPAWIAALQPLPRAPVDLAGDYRNVGEGAGLSYVRNHRFARSNLASNLFRDLSAEKRSLLSRARTVELRQPDVTHLTMIARNGTEVLAETTVLVTIEPKSGWVSLPNHDGLQAGAFGTAGYQKDRIALFKGNDGCLYLDHVSGGAGVALVIVPVVGSQETWGRWEQVMALPK